MARARSAFGPDSRATSVAVTPRARAFSQAIRSRASATIRSVCGVGGASHNERVGCTTVTAPLCSPPRSCRGLPPGVGAFPGPWGRPSPELYPEQAVSPPDECRHSGGRPPEWGRPSPRTGVGIRGDIVVRFSWGTNRSPFRLIDSQCEPALHIVGMQT